VKAAAAVCGAEIHGAELNSQTLEFYPQYAPQSGRYTFDVAAEARQGSAGSTSLILQTIMWPLLFSQGESHVTVRGGTHVNHSPTFHYLQNVTLPHYNRFGIRCLLTLHEWGWFPEGGGQVQLEIFPLEGQMLRPVVLEPQPTNKIHGLSIATNLPGHIPHRMARRADNLLTQAGYDLQIDTKRQRNHSEGAGLFLWADNGRAGGAGFGRPGYPSQNVAEDAVRELFASFPHKGHVDRFLVDQLLIPMALASGRSTMTVNAWTPHAETNAAVLQKWLDIKIIHHQGVVTVTGKAN
jgi:RNA 3'-terminal phosphate cyclase (ATP)